MLTKSKDGWWHEFFKHFHPYFAKYGIKQTNAEVRYFIHKLNLKKGSSFLDCPCGIGRVSIPMAKKGIKITGIDTSRIYLDELAARAKKQNLPIKLYEKDMRKINYENTFDAAGNIWTSFGYFEKESDNMLVLKKFYKALKPGGRFLLHVINRDWIMKNFLARNWDPVGDMKILEEREFDYRLSKMHDNWTFIKNGEQHTVCSTIRLYSYHELYERFSKVGFVDIEGFGSLNDDPISNNSREMIIIGTKQ